MKTNKILFLFLLSTILIPSLVFSAMSSTNYYIYADSVDYGGGLATSTSYDLQDSVGGGDSTGISTSTSYEVRAGYQAAVKGVLSMSLSSDNIDIGSLSASGLVFSSSMFVTVDTNSVTGYSLSISNVNGVSLADVSDGAVDGDSGSEEYGLALTGSNRMFSDDRAIVNGLVLVSSSAPVVSDQSTLIFKAVRSNNSGAASYSQLVTITASANL
jgi:hypothetical protein